MLRYDSNPSLITRPNLLKTIVILQEKIHFRTTKVQYLHLRKPH